MMKKMIAYCGQIVKNATHILQQSMTIKNCEKKLQNYGLN